MAKLSLMVPRLVALFLVAGFSLLLAACGGPMSYTIAKGEVAHKVLGLHAIIFWLSVIVFVGVQLVLVWVALRYRHKPGEPNRVPSQVHGNTRLEIIWSILPVIIVVIIAVPTVQLISEFTTIPTTPDTVKVRVIGHQWWWEFQYPDLNITTADELVIPVNQPIAFDLESADVIHSFWVPYLSGTLDTIPGRVNQMWFKADEPGNYHGQCKEFCGSSHALMRFRTVAKTKADFDAWVKQHQSPPPPPTTGDAARGAVIFGAVKPPAGTPPVSPKQGTCAACHAIGNTEAKGLAGPNLTLFGQRSTVAAGILDNTPENLAAWLKDPPGMKPGSKMPNYDLSPEDIQALVAYLESLK